MIKKTLLTVIMGIAMATTAFAIPVKPGVWKTITLQNGTQIRAEYKGDEFVQFLEAADGRRYQRIGNSDVYQEVSHETIANIALSTREKAIADREAILLQVEKSNAKYAAAKQKRMGIGGDHQPYIGKKKCLCIIMEYKDMPYKAEHDINFYKNQINTVGFKDETKGYVASVRDYFLTQSNGKFDIEFDIAGPYTTTNSYKYYGSGGKGGAKALISEAIDKADNDVNFSDYDWDNDGVCEAIYIVYSGKCEYDNSDYIWPHKSSTNKFKDGVQIIDYACGSELESGGEISGIGTMCHEYSHCLGLPDTYDVDYNCNFGDNWYDIMCSGCYSGNDPAKSNGFVPSGYNAWELMYCGWLEPIELTKPCHIEDMKPLNEGGPAYIIRNDAKPDECILLEAHGKTGFDAGQWGQGLAVYYVDYNKNAWKYNVVNCVARFPQYNNHNSFTLIPADGNLLATTATGISTDLYPTTVNNQFTDYSSPTVEWYTRNLSGTKKVGMPIVNITKTADGVVSFDVLEDITPTPAPEGAMFYESFDMNNNLGCVGGNDNKFTKVSTLGCSTDNPGWTYSDMRGALECAFVGSPTSDASGEYASTPYFTLERDKEYVMTFRVAPYSIKSTALTLAKVTGIVNIETSSFDLTRSKWTECSTKLTGNGRVKLKFSRPTAFYLDEVLVMPYNADGIESINTDENTSSAVYNILGQRINSNAKGLVIMNGKKVFKK